MNQYNKNAFKTQKIFISMFKMPKRKNNDTRYKFETIFLLFI